MSTPPAAPRRWFSFRLSTLLLAVWTVAAGGLIWHRWEPWEMAYEIPPMWRVISDDHRYLLTSTDNRLRLWDLVADRTKYVYHGTEEIVFADVSNQLERIVAMEELSDLNACNVRMWDFSSQLIGEMPFRKPNHCPHPAVHDRIIFRNKLSWELWQMERGRQPYQIFLHDSGVSELSPNGSFVADSNGSVWDLATLELLELPGQIISDISNEDLVILTQSQKAPFVYDLQHRQNIGELAGGPFYEQGSRRFSFNSEYVVLSVNDVPHVWHARTGVQIDKLPDTSNRDWRYFESNANDSKRGSARIGLFNLPSITDRVCVWFDIEAEIWRRRHPEWWWGHFYRPEVWAGIVLAGIWLVKLWRRIFRRTAAA